MLKSSEGYFGPLLIVTHRESDSNYKAHSTQLDSIKGYGPATRCEHILAHVGGDTTKARQVLLKIRSVEP